MRTALALGSIQVQGRHLCEQAEVLNQLQGGQNQPLLSFPVQTPSSCERPLFVDSSRDSDGKTRLSGGSELYFHHDTGEESLKKEGLKLKVENGKQNFYLSTSLCGWWGMGSNTTAAAAAEQKPHELPNGWMKKVPAATAK